MKISVKEASKMMGGVSPNLLRLMIREERIPGAFAVKNKQKFYYYINRKAFIDFLKNSN